MNNGADLSNREVVEMVKELKRRPPIILIINSMCELLEYEDKRLDGRTLMQH